jgi:hypothetical protein
MGRAHLFFAEQIGDTSVLYHSDVNELMSDPVDIHVGAFNTVRVVADRIGMVYLIATGANNSVLFSSAKAEDAGSAAAWEPLREIATATLGADLATDGAGRLHLCYPSGNELRHSMSSDGGATWTNGVGITQTHEVDAIAVEVSCAVDSEGVVHAIWSEVVPPNYYPSLGIYYSNSSTEGKSWHDPELIAGLHNTLPRLLPTDSGLVHLIWQGDVALGGRYYRNRIAGLVSQWTPTESLVPPGEGGMSGVAGMAVDGLDRLHAVVAVTKGTVWAARDDGWTPTVLLTGTLHDLPNRTGSVGEGPSLAIAQGNELTLTFNFDLHRVYMIQGLINSPQAMATPDSLPTNNATAVRLKIATPLPTAILGNPTATRALAAEGFVEFPGGQSNIGVILGLLSAVIIVAAALQIQRTKR